MTVEFDDPARVRRSGRDYSVLAIRLLRRLLSVSKKEMDTRIDADERKGKPVE